MSTIHFLNVLEGDCNIIHHDSGRISVIDVSNAWNDYDTLEERSLKSSLIRLYMHTRTEVPSDKKDYKQKEIPDNPIRYIKERLNSREIFRFVITHPDMDHLDGIRDLFEEFEITNTWDTNNNKKLDLDNFVAGYKKEDWLFYTNLRGGSYNGTKRLTLYDYQQNLYWSEDYIKILCPTEELVKHANETSKDYNDLSYVLLFKPPKINGGNWKIIFAGDSHDKSWEYICDRYKKEISNIDILFAPHHGRDSDRNYDFIKILNPKLTLLGNASSKHLAYSAYPPIRITNNQAGYVIIDISQENFVVYVKNFEFAKDFKEKRGWSMPTFDGRFQAYPIIQFQQ